MFSDPQFWVAIAFIIFILAIFNPVRKILNSSLDTKINEIKESIEEAENLKNDTQVTLSEIKKRQNEVELEIKEIHLNSKNKIKILESQAQIKLSEQNSKRESLAKAKIEQMVRDANLMVKQHITQTAINAAVIVLEKKLNAEEKQNLINQSIKDLESVFKN
jgi:F-type H+-transporting ATPase subunit b|tara:strand:+ start:62 stop:547 length:486 start_codon:yes stop_codon:yes gene_type:complete